MLSPRLGCAFLISTCQSPTCPLSLGSDAIYSTKSGESVAWNRVDASVLLGLLQGFVKGRLSAPNVFEKMLTRVLNLQLGMKPGFLLCLPGV